MGMALLRNALYEAAGRKWKATNDVPAIETVPVWSPLGTLRKKDSDFEPADPSDPSQVVASTIFCLMMCWRSMSRQAFTDEKEKNPASGRDVDSWRKQAPLLATRSGAAEGAQLVRDALRGVEESFTAQAAQNQEPAQTTQNPVATTSPQAPRTAITTAENWDVETTHLLEELRAEETATIEVPLDVRLTATEAVAYVAIGMNSRGGVGALYH